MGTTFRTRRLLIVAGVVAVVLLGAGVAVVVTSNDARCDQAEQEAISGFPHFDGALPEWESNVKITGGCTTSFVVTAGSDEVLAYYQQQLTRQGWTVQPPAPNSYPPALQVERDGFQFFLMFEGLPSTDVTGEDVIIVKAGTPVVPEADALDVEDGVTRVSISGGRQP